jgi:hypothetical protein
MNPYTMVAAWMIDGGWSTELRRTERDLAHRRALADVAHAHRADTPRPALGRRLTVAFAGLRRASPAPATMPAVAAVDSCPACA